MTVVEDALKGEAERLDKMGALVGQQLFDLEESMDLLYKALDTADPTVVVEKPFFEFARAHRLIKIAGELYPYGD